MKITKGTPKTLDEAIQNAICIGPASEAPDEIYSHVKYFCAKRFGVLLLKYSTLPEIENDLKELFELIFQREEVDPSPYCSWCGASRQKYCNCGPRAEND